MLDIVLYPFAHVGELVVLAGLIHYYRHTHYTQFGPIYSPALTRAGYGRR